MSTVTNDVAYGPDPLQTLDVYQPEQANGAALIDIHGGGWWFGDKAKDAGLATRLAQAGYLVFAVNYRLADSETRQNLYPTAVDDVQSAFAWVKSSAYEFDRSRIGFIGGSSGGNLAVEASLLSGAPAVSWSGLLDLEGFMARHEATVPEKRLLSELAASSSIDQNGSDDPYYKWVVLNYLGQDTTLLHEATPIHRVTSAAGPMFLANSLKEFVPVDEPTTMQQALSAAGIPSRTVILQGTRHAEAYLSDVWAATLDFLAYYLPAKA
ncbi:MAG: alpha/beta hydrolase [Coriobacteriales bacterium]|jgi:acetyl esterase/lipase|nr:alpha/beta hydrolase [Coriobacteriales bacterium]